ncbi:hypothetical protein Acr_25g0004730 [Actinidia rufa]|uniref:Secreted protein n=1 Tax=Actinidia rufa TaxID=165716 RepID=A0A7J0GZV8_9ERIC|nr:hypothetical protein Acr_25g0004730 [Actinidia rufa]
MSPLAMLVTMDLIWMLWFRAVVMLDEGCLVRIGIGLSGLTPAGRVYLCSCAGRSSLVRGVGGGGGCALEREMGNAWWLGLVGQRGGSMSGCRRERRGGCTVAFGGD